MKSVKMMSQLSSVSQQVSSARLSGHQQCRAMASVLPFRPRSRFQRSPCSVLWQSASCRRRSLPRASSKLTIVNRTVEKLTAEELEVAIQERSKPLIIDFYATWCGPCLLLAKELEEVYDIMGDSIRVVKVDTDENPQLSTQLQIQGLPTMVFVGLDKNKPALRTEGLLPATTIMDIIKNQLMDGQPIDVAPSEQRGLTCMPPQEFLDVWIKESLELDPRVTTRVLGQNSLYEAYLGACREQEQTSESIRRFRRRLDEHLEFHFNIIGIKFKGKNGVIYRGLKLKTRRSFGRCDVVWPDVLVFAHHK